MTYIPAENWPKFTKKNDTFSPNSVSGFIYQSAPSPPPTTAGPKCSDGFVKETIVDINGKTSYQWRDLKTAETIYLDPCPPPKPQGSSGTKVKMKKSNWIGLAGSYGGRAASYIAYQLWTKDGQSIVESSLSGAYIRRGGKFTEKSGTEWFMPFEKFTTLRYKPRDLFKNPPYVSQGDAFRAGGDEIFNPTTPTTLTAEDIALAQAIAAGLGGVIGATTVVTDPTDDGNSNNNNNNNRNNNRNNRKNVPEPPPLPIPAITITTRMPKGYAGRAVGGTARPQMVQRYQTEGAKYADEAFIFRYIPQGIKYSGLGSNWVEIPRAEDIPFVDWASWQLMKVSFSFVIAADRTESGGAVVPDGLDIPVDDQIEKLRRMAQRKVPVTLVNFDDMLTFQLRRGEQSRKGTNIYVGEDEKRIRTTQPNMEFVIQDLSVTATRRTSQQQVGEKDKDGLRSSSMLSLIAVAQCEITLTETPVETVGIIALPEITTPGLPPSKKKPPGSNSQKYEYITDITAPTSSAYNAYANDNIATA